MKKMKIHTEIDKHSTKYHKHISTSGTTFCLKLSPLDCTAHHLLQLILLKRRLGIRECTKVAAQSKILNKKNS